MYSTIDVDESGYESDKTDATAFSDSYLVPFEQEDDNEEEEEPDTAGEHSLILPGQEPCHCWLHVSGLSARC